MAPFNGCCWNFGIDPEQRLRRECPYPLKWKLIFIWIYLVTLRTPFWYEPHPQTSHDDVDIVIVVKKLWSLNSFHTYLHFTRFLIFFFKFFACLWWFCMQTSEQWRNLFLSCLNSTVPWYFALAITTKTVVFITKMYPWTHANVAVPRVAATYGSSYLYCLEPAFPSSCCTSYVFYPCRVLIVLITWLSLH